MAARTLSSASTWWLCVMDGFLIRVCDGVDLGDDAGGALERGSRDRTSPSRDTLKPQS
ncbi:hypothetical protein GCM10009647_090280 [Streptomyces sanglieri]